MNRNKSKNRGIRLQWKIFISLFAVAMIILLILWACQVLMISAFYRSAKTKELERITDEFTELIEDNGTDAGFEHIVLEGDINVRIINIADFKDVFTGGDSIISATRDIGHFEILKLYDLAKQNGGEVSKYYTYDKERQLFLNAPPPLVSYDSESDEDAKENGYSKERGSEIGVGFVPGRSTVFMRNDRYVDDFLYARIVLYGQGEEIMIISDVHVTPLDSTVDILKAQLKFASVISLIIALAVSYFVSRHISKPIEELNESALKLARGNFDTKFSGKGYREIEQLSDTLNFTASELGKVEQFRNELLANVSHDLRTPLTMIGGYAEVMRDIPGENTPENIQVIIDETQRLTSFVNDILDQSKLKSGMENLKLEKTDITGLMERIKERYTWLIKQEGYSVEIEASEHVYVSCDESKISQALYNLMDNAVNHTGEDKRVKIKQTVHGNTVKIEICDTGKGIPSELLPHIWDRYYKADSGHKRSVSGSGIGLAIVKSVFEAHKLKYGVESSENRGTVFWVEFKKI